MQPTTLQSELKPHRTIPFLLYLIGGLLIFLFGSNTYLLFPTNRNGLYEWGLTLFLLLLVFAMRKIQPLQIYLKIAYALFVASFANALNLELGNFLGRLLPGTTSDAQAIAIDKLSQAIPIVLAIILLTLWARDDLGSLYLKKGDLRQGLRFGLISFGVFVLLFAVIVVFQAYGPPSVGLIASGVSLSTIVRAIPWILVFIFANSFMEELLFRGVSLRNLTPLLGRTLTILVTALVFGFTHLGVTYITPVQMFIFPVIVFGLGLINAYMMLKTDSIWGSVLFHAGYDLMVIIPVLASM